MRLGPKMPGRSQAQPTIGLEWLSTTRVELSTYRPVPQLTTSMVPIAAGNDLYANTLLALDANTGKLIWHFQGVHHDIWDRDFPSPPALVTVMSKGRSIDAVAQNNQAWLRVSL